MSIVYLDEQGSELKKRGELFIVEKEGATIAEIPLTQLDRMVIIGNVQISTQALALLLNNAIPVSFVTSYGNYRGKLTPPTHKNIALRLKQYECYNNKIFKLNLAKIFVKAKIKNSKIFLQKHARNNPGINIDNEINTIDTMINKCDNAESQQELMGFEGISAKNYFAVFGKLVKKEFEFEQRTKRPPKDPVNALLSLGYTLLFNEMVSATEILGFDPYLGFLHEIEYGRPSLAVDLMEEFRYLIDGLTLTLINKEMLSRENFIGRDDGGFYLNEKGRETFYSQYEKRITSEIQYYDMNVNYRRIFYYQAEKLARVVKGEDAKYIAFETK